MTARPITAIRVPSRYLIEPGRPVIAVASFMLGPGPCGRTVTTLAYEYEASAFSIVQMHEDGTAATFIYPLAQITGRIEISYG